jgi:hypothetical protein
MWFGAFCTIFALRVTSSDCQYILPKQSFADCSGGQSCMAYTVTDPPGQECAGPGLHVCTEDGYEVASVYTYWVGSCSDGTCQGGFLARMALGEAPKCKLGSSCEN